MLPICCRQSMHVIDAVRVCLACVVNVHPLVPVSESCCPLHMFTMFLCLHYINVQTSSHTMTTICQYTHTHKYARTPKTLWAPPPNNIPSCLYIQQKNQWSFDGDKRPERRSSWTLFLYVSTLSSFGRCHSKSWWASRPTRLSRWEPAEVKAMWNHTWDLWTPLSNSFSSFFALSCSTILGFDLGVLTVQSPRLGSGFCWGLTENTVHCMLYFTVL